MFSNEKAIKPQKDQQVDITALIENEFYDFLYENKLCAGLFCLWDDELNSANIITSIEIPITPFQGTKKHSLESFITECLETYPAPHVHTISGSLLLKEISSLIKIDNWQFQAIFIPALGINNKYILICFSDDEKPNITVELNNRASDVIQLAEFLLSVNKIKSRLYSMEIYVREIGHDIASSVQAIISKIRVVRRGLLQGPAAMAKLQEAEDEIMSAYRIADTLGITVDPDYNIGNGDEFSIQDAIRDAIKLVQSEAQERHIELRTDVPSKTINVWGDVKAIQSAMIQLLMNAIKYAKGSSYITLSAKVNRDKLIISVTNMGIPIKPEDHHHMWDFGWRGEKAKELHVNGSGIGLYTVNKIIKAHGGTVNCKTSGYDNEASTFSFAIPLKGLLEKTSLL